MDPDANLARQLELAKQIVYECERGIVRDEYAVELAYGFLDLHEWLSRGGFKPKAWGSAVATSIKETKP